jgi:universal stress protein A
MTIKRIVVPIDFSPPSQVALDYALGLAAQVGASVRVLHVVAAESRARAERGALERAAAQRLRRTLPRVAGIPLGLAHEIRIGDPAAQIVDCAREALADVIVMGTRARGDAGHEHGTVDWVTQNGPCPVVLLPPIGDGARQRGPAPLPAARRRGREQARTGRGRSRSRTTPSA